MTNTVKLVETIDDRDVLEGFQKQNKLLDQMQRRLEKIDKASGKAGKTAKDGFANAGREVTKFLATVAGISTVMQGLDKLVVQVRREIQNIQSRQRGAADTQLEIAATQRNALKNFGGERGQALLDAIASISSDTGARQTDLYATASTALSFKGDSLTDQDAFDAVRVAAMLSPDNQQDQQATSQAILAQQKLTGGTAEQIAGFQIAVKRSSPVASDADFGTNVAPVIASSTQFGNTARQSGALAAAIGQGVGDPTGRVSGTAQINFEKQLAQLLPNVQGGTFARLDVIRQDDELRNRLLGSLDRAASEAGTDDKGELTTEAKAFVALSNLLQKDSNATQELLNRTYDALPELADAEKYYTQTLESINAVAIQQTANLERGLEQIGERLRADNTEGARTAITRDQFASILKDAGLSDLEQRVALAKFEFRAGISEVNPVSTAAEIIRQRETNLRAGSIVSAGPGAAPTRAPASAENLAQARVFDRIADELEALAVALEGNSKATDRNTKAANAGGSNPAAGNSRENR
ncbi:hypothetical protein KOR42_39350 [Thalassoglobus neptunius]|uniref:Phage-related minor tail protein n=1 Tax=Thalassoglobus neptunius TaxID=1938619 RepID=A0A5C5WG00_9PLAN|nr:hypothetical protein [Thalassoglobus neptunius]TWT49019.1 hypothetical protein KOR42_39350 [Thalassoglobus neptunius]